MRDAGVRLDRDIGMFMGVESEIPLPYSRDTNYAHILLQHWGSSLVGRESIIQLQHGYDGCMEYVVTLMDYVNGSAKWNFVGRSESFALAVCRSFVQANDIERSKTNAPYGRADDDSRV